MSPDDHISQHEKNMAAGAAHMKALMEKIYRAEYKKLMKKEEDKLGAGLHPAVRRRSRSKC